MTGFDARRWQAASRWLERALELPTSERVAWLAALELEQPEIARDLRSLLEAAEQPGYDDFLAEAPALEGQRFGAYVLVRELGEGGMGSVWLGRRDDGRFAGHVAIKLPTLSRLTRAASARFEREGALLGRLSHPHIARLLDAGVQRSQPYLVLEYVDGQPIDAWCDARRLGVRERLGLFLDVLDAVAHAHANLVLHRDLKPSNILVDVEGRAKLLDFGVAKLLDDDARPVASTELTREAGRAFTPAYAAPEQHAGGSVTTATDVYSLGVLLYVLLSARHPTLADADGARGGAAPVDAASLSTAAARTSPEAAAARATTPTRLVRALRGDLENIVGTALKVDPVERYPTVQAFADDLRRYLRDEPVVARRDSVRYRAAKFVRRHRYAVGAASAISLALIAGIAGTTWQALEAGRQRDAALLEARRADQSRLFVNLLVAEIGDGSQPLKGRDIIDRGAELLRAQEQSDPRFVADELLQLSSAASGMNERARARALLVEAERRARELGDPVVLARALCEWTDVDLAEDRRADAERRLAEARTLFGDGGTADEVAVGCLSAEANVLDAAGDSHGAIARAQQAIDRLLASGRSRHPLHSALLSRLSKYYDDLGDRRRAFEYNLQSARAALEDGTAGTLNGLVTQSNYAADLFAFGEFRAAADVFADVVARAAKRGDVPVDFATNHGGVLATLGRFDAAGPALDAAIASAVDVGDRSWELRARSHRARMLTSANRLTEADDALAELERAYGRDPEQNRIPLVSVGAVRADWLRRSGRNAEALALAEELLQRIGYPDDPTSRRFSPTLVPLAAQIALAAGEVERALALARAGLADAEAAAREVEQSGDVGRARLVLGRVLAAHGDAAAGRAMLESALVPLRNGFGEEHWLTREARAELGG